MAYASTAVFRLITAFKTTDISDADVTSLIAHADRMIMRLMNTKVHLEKLTGTIDGSNTYFYTKHRPIADTDASDAVDKDDVEVYYATYDTENKVYYGSSAATVTSVQAEEGRITMTTAPTSSTAEAGVYANYSYTAGDIDTNLLKLASNYIVAHLTSFKIRGLAPDFSATEATFLRRDIAGAPDEWLRMAISLVNLCLGAKEIGFRNIKTDLPDEIE